MCSIRNKSIFFFIKRNMHHHLHPGVCLVPCHYFYRLIWYVICVNMYNQSWLSSAHDQRYIYCYLLRAIRGLKVINCLNCHSPHYRANNRYDTSLGLLEVRPYTVGVREVSRTIITLTAVEATTTHFLLGKKMLTNLLRAVGL